MSYKGPPELITWPEGKPRPKNGDIMVGCCHAQDGALDRLHFYQFATEPLRFRRPDGTDGEAHWMMMCSACFNIYGNHPLSCPIGCDCMVTEGMLSPGGQA